MGGGSPSQFSANSSFASALKPSFPLDDDSQNPPPTDDNDSNEYGEFVKFCMSTSFSDPCFTKRNLDRVREQIMQQYLKPESRSQTLEVARDEILGYKPGAWVEEVGGLKIREIDIPKTATLLLVGPRGSGKSSLVNRISRVVEDGSFSVDRAQVSYADDLSVGDGTCFLQEYMIPRNSSSFCVYDTGGLSQNSLENFKLLKDWIINGVQHGQMVVRDSDDNITRMNMERKARLGNHCPSVKRMVNFVIFVVDGLSVLKSMIGEDTKEYINLIVNAFKCPYLSFKDDKPVIVVTHGDKLPLIARAQVRIHLGTLLGVPPDKQIFDIPDDSELSTEFAIMDLLIYSLEHADRNIHLKKKSPLLQKLAPWLMVIILVALLAMIVGYLVLNLQCRPLVHVEWRPSPLVSDATQPSTPIVEEFIRPIPRIVWKPIQPSGRERPWHEVRHIW